ncbi:response regulator transcription factor [Patescibacteria group bacterium]|nr:response regulator transcription factor [Patescibacteria group bacterium]MBU1703083.1 response regulator transcription factor [Patescibacteria group bacterium]MBU1953683.1 response regulator transcription factor [Patescibacteria group bacterium]
MRILIIEDEKDLSFFLAKILEAEKHTVVRHESAEEAIKNNSIASCDLLLLDLLLPGQSGESFLEKIRRDGCKVPVLVLSAKDAVSTKVDVLEMGADDYMVKPFHAEELLARINTLHRRAAGIGKKEKNKEKKLAFADLELFPGQNMVMRQGEKIYLTKKETQLLAFFINNSEKVVRMEDILQKVWGAKDGHNSNILQSTVRRLRKKIDHGFPRSLIHNRHGVGYIISAAD